MSTDLWYCTGADALQRLCELLIAEGEEVAPRGQKTFELRNVVITIEDITDTLATEIGRKQNQKLAAMEALQLIGGFSMPEKTIKAAPNIAQFAETAANGKQYFHGAYGHRTCDQFAQVIERLQDDPNTRQAIVTVWDSYLDLEAGHKDYPCTLSFTFSIRKGKLLMATHMRSNDVWWGWTYDVFQFTQLQLTVAHVLGIEAGPYTHYVDSLHMYDRDRPAIDKFIENFPWNYINRYSYHPIGLFGDTWEEIQSRALGIATGEIEGTGTEQWYSDQIRKIHDSA